MDVTAAIAVSGLTTASTRLQVSASNVANMDDAGPKPFVPTRVATVSLPSGGVEARLSPAAPGAQVDLVGEMVDQMMAMQQYKASAALIAADDRLQKSTMETC
ncbi:MAG: flagellar basal body rod C-terminal domain-containing protein [Caulobacteraceae bacterium]